MALTTTINYNTPANFTYDSNLIEVLTSAKLKALVYANEIFYNNFSQTTALRGGGVLTASAGSAVISSGKLACLANNYLEYSAVGNVDALTSKGCIRFKYTPNYSGNPASNINIFNIGNASNVNNSIQLIQLTSGHLQFRVYNSSGVQIVSAIYIWSPTSGTEYYFNLNFDVVSGSSSLSINGITVVSSSATGTRTASGVDTLQIGRVISAASSNFYIDDLQIFSEVKTAEASWAEQYQYSITNPSIVVASGITADALISFLATVTVTGSDAVKFTLVNGSELYWDGAAWSVASGTYAQSNTAAEILTNIAALDISAGYIIKVKAYLHSNNGHSTPTLTSVSLDYDFFAFVVDQANCVVYGYIYDGASPVSGATIKFKSKAPYFSNETLISVNESLTTNASGYFEVSLPEGVTANKNLIASINFTDSLGAKYSKSFEIRVPSSNYATLEDIAVL